MALVTLDNWRARMDEDMRLVDYRERTQEAYGLAMRLFFEHVPREPATLTEDDVRRYFLHLRDERKFSSSYLNIAVCALRFFFQRTLGVDWEVFQLLRVQRTKALPTVLSIDEVRQILSTVRLPVRRMALTTIYALGLRILEGLQLKVCHIDSSRSLAWVRQGKGNKDRCIPLPRPLLERLRYYWKHERPASATQYLFVPAHGQGPFEESTVQKTFTTALRETPIQKHATVHTLRHSYATHLVEAGVSLRTIQAILGHQSLRTTEIYLHVTTAGVERVQEVVDTLMTGLLDFGGATGVAGVAAPIVPNTPPPHSR